MIDASISLLQMLATIRNALFFILTLNPRFVIVHGMTEGFVGMVQAVVIVMYGENCALTI
jgi:hypothetical protein